MDVPAGPWKSDFLYDTNFLPNFPPISTPFSKEKHPILTKLFAFTIICPEYTQFMLFGLLPFWWPLPMIAIPNFVLKYPKRQAHIRISCQCENPPRYIRQFIISLLLHPYISICLSPSLCNHTLSPKLTNKSQTVIFSFWALLTGLPSWG